jgi:hypothetical protein
MQHSKVKIICTLLFIAFALMQFLRKSLTYFNAISFTLVEIIKMNSSMFKNTQNFITGLNGTMGLLAGLNRYCSPGFSTKLFARK